MQEVAEMKRQGLSIQAISKLLGFDRKTVRKYLIEPVAKPEYGPRPKPPSKLDRYQPYLEERLQAGVWNARVLLRELRERGYDGGYTILTDWLRPKRKMAHTVAVRRFETPPGQQAQVDWGHLGTVEVDGRQDKLWGFVLTLSYSRMMFAMAATNQKLGTLLRMHERAFEELGGVPEEILLDFVAGHKIVLLWRTPLCGAIARNRAGQGGYRDSWNIILRAIRAISANLGSAAIRLLGGMPPRNRRAGGTQSPRPAWYAV